MQRIVSPARCHLVATMHKAQLSSGTGHGRRLGVLLGSTVDEVDDHGSHGVSLRAIAASAESVVRVL